MNEITTKKTTSTALSVNPIIENALSITRSSDMKNYAFANLPTRKSLELYHDVDTQISKLLRKVLRDKEKELEKNDNDLKDQINRHKLLDELYEATKIEIEEELENAMPAKMNAINVQEECGEISEEEASYKRLCLKNNSELAEKHGIEIPKPGTFDFGFMFRQLAVWKEAEHRMGNINYNLWRDLSSIIKHNKAAKDSLMAKIKKLQSTNYHHSNDLEALLSKLDFNEPALISVKEFIKDNHLEIVKQFMPLAEAFPGQSEQRGKLAVIVGELMKKTNYAKTDDQSIAAQVILWEEDINIYSIYSMQQGFIDYYKSNSDFPRAIATLRQFIEYHHTTGITLLSNVNFINSL